MPAQTVTLLGRKYVLLPESEYRKMNGVKHVSRTQIKAKSTRKIAEDPDVVEAMRRLNDPRERRTSWETVKREAGLA